MQIDYFVFFQVKTTFENHKFTLAIVGLLENDSK